MSPLFLKIQDMAYIKASKKYNYRQEEGEYNDKIVKHKKNR
mgnify:FL=1